LSEGFMPQLFKRSLFLPFALAVAKPLGSGLGLHRFDIHSRDKACKE
jgi:hypothetical protein